MQGLTRAAVAAAENGTLMLNSTLNRDKVTRVRYPSQGHWVLVHT